MNIRVDLNYPIKDGTEVVFRSPVDCSQVTGLKVYYLENGITTSKEFAFADAHGNNVGDIDHLFAENVAVKVILDVATSMAFVQNADTNAYLEGRLAECVSVAEQTLTEAQKAQARENIGLANANIAKSATRNMLNVTWGNAIVSNGEYVEITTGKDNAFEQQYIPVVGGECYTFSFSGTDCGKKPHIYYYEYDANRIYLKNTAIYNAAGAHTKQFSENTAFIRIGIYFDGEDWQSIIPNDYQMEQGTNATSYIKPLVIDTDELNVAEIAEKAKEIGSIPSDETHSATIGRTYPVLNWVQGSHTHETNTDITRIKAGYFQSAGGKVIVRPPNGYDCAVRTFSLPNSDTFISDTGWVSGDIELDVAAGLYYTVCISNADHTTAIPVSVGENVEVYEMTNPNSVMNRMEDEVKKISEDGGTSGLLLSNTVKTIAHRGNDIDAPECTVPAYISARKRGHTIAENDVNITSDGVYVMWHGTTFALLGQQMADTNGYILYTDGNGNFYWYDSANGKLYGSDYTESSQNVSSLSVVSGYDYGPKTLPYAVVSKLDVGKWLHIKFAGTTISTFDEWVLLCKQLGMEIYIDKKIYYTDTDVKSLVAIVRKYGMLDKATWLNIDYTEAVKIRSQDPNARLALLVHCTESLAESWQELNQSGRGVVFNGDAKTMTGEEAAIALEHGYGLEYWYVDYGNASSEEVFEVIRTAVSYGAQGITTDKYRVDEAFAYLLQ